jgi:hypothetical protein
MRALNVLAAFAALVALLILALGKRREVRAPSWVLLRVLFPSWRFFESIAPTPNLSYRVARAGEDFGGWRDALPPVARTPLSLLLNARGNLQLAAQSLVERLFEDLDAMPPAEAQENVSYQLVQCLVQTRLRDDAAEAGHRYQFRLTLPESDEEACFVSLIHDG